jgi:hypothetical protein
MAKDREPFVSGAYRADETTREPKDLAQIAKSAIAERIKSQMRRRYGSRGTPATRKITQRMLGERDDD